MENSKEPLGYCAAARWAAKCIEDNKTERVANSREYRTAKELYPSVFNSFKEYRKESN